MLVVQLVPAANPMEGRTFVIIGEVFDNAADVDKRCAQRIKTLMDTAMNTPEEVRSVARDN